MFSLLAQEVSVDGGGFARLYPNAKFADIRGNVGTRLKKLSDGLYDGIILCAAGTERLGLSLEEYEVKEFEPGSFCLHLVRL